MKMLLLGLVLAMTAIWGGAYLGHLWDGTWAVMPIIVSAMLLFIVAVALICIGGTKVTE